MCLRLPSRARFCAAIGLLVSLLTGTGGRNAVASNAPGAPEEEPVAWVRAGMTTNRPIWGVPGGLLWGLPSPADQSDGPRGLIRLRYPVLPDGGYDLLNFIAVEPIVQGRKDYSELEPSKLDGVQGKRIWAIDADSAPGVLGSLSPGQVTRLEGGAESLCVRVGVERFENGAHVELTLRQRGDRPDELELTLHAKPDSAPIDYCILTATMGNKARVRRLWLKDEMASSLALYPDYRDPDFAPHRLFPLDRLLKTPAGEVLAAVTTDEPDPAAADPRPAPAHWRYNGFSVTQYWRKPSGAWRADLHVAVNARYTYWLSRQPIPGGVAFENFEMRERFHEGQRFVFGITRRTPTELGFGSRTNANESVKPGRARE